MRHYMENIHSSAITLNPVTDDLISIDDLITVAPGKGWDILGNNQFTKLMCWKQEKWSCAWFQVYCMPWVKF